MKTLLSLLALLALVFSSAAAPRRQMMVNKAAAASPTWTWATLGADLIQWNTAEAVSGNHQDLITTWTASAGDNLANAGGSARPKLMTNGITGRAVKTLYFDGTDDWFDGGSFSNAQPFTIACTFIATNVSVGTMHVYDGLHDNDARAILRFTTVPQMLMYSGTFQTIGDGNTSLRTALVVYDGANSRIALDGANWITVGDTGSQPIQGVTLGIAQDRTSVPFGGHMREWVLTSGTNWLTTHYANATNYQHADVR